MTVPPESSSSETSSETSLPRSQTASSSRTGQLLRYLLSALVIALLVMFARTVNWGDAWDSMKHASLPLLTAAVLANFSTLLFRGARWWLFLRKAGAPSFALAMRATIVGAGLNNVLIANGGEAARVVFVTRATGVPSAKILATVALDRLFDPVGFVAILLLGFGLFQLPEQIESFRIPAIIAGVAIVGLLAWFSMRTAKRPGDATETVDAMVPHDGTWGEKTRAWLSVLGRSMREMMVGPQVIPVLILTLLAWLSQLLTFGLAAAAAHVTLPLAASLAALLMVNLSLVIRPTPGNVGLFQMAYTVAAAEFGVGKEQAIAISILIQTLQVVPVTIIGVAMAPEFIFKRKKVATTA